MGQSLLTHSLEVEAQAYTQPVSRRKTKAPAPAGADVLLFAGKLERHAAILSTTTPNVSRAQRSTKWCAADLRSQRARSLATPDRRCITSCCSASGAQKI